MAKFAVYFVPQGRFYDLGSSILGYDLRSPIRRDLARPEVRERLQGFAEDWTSRCKQYGFHMTITDSMTFRMGDIAQIEHEIEDILACFSPRSPFTLTAEADFVDFFGPDKSAVVLKYAASEALKILHAVLVARLHPYALESGFLRVYLKNQERFAEEACHVARIKKFFSPTIFDSYAPHFTLLDPYTGEDREGLMEVLGRVFGEFEQITVSGVCLLLQLAPGQNWIIYREFSR